MKFKLLLFKNDHNSLQNWNIIKNQRENTDKVLKFNFNKILIHSNI